MRSHKIQKWTSLDGSRGQTTIISHERPLRFAPLASDMFYLSFGPLNAADCFVRFEESY